MAEIAQAPPRSGTRVFARILWFVVLPLLIIVALLLPPFSLSERIPLAGFTSLGSAGGTVTDGNGAEFTVPSGALTAETRVKLQPVNSLSPSATAALPRRTRLVGTAYAIAARGDATPTQAVLRMPVGADVGPRETLDVYVWDGANWSWVPHHFDGSSVVADLSGLPQRVAVVQTGPVTPAVAVTLPERASLGETPDAVSAVSPAGLHVEDDGSIGGQLELQNVSELSDELFVVPVITNRVDDVVRSDWVDNLLINDQARERHASAVAAHVIERGYDGIVVDYRGIDPQLRDLLTAFIQHLGDRLHAENRRLTVAVDVPARSESGWDTGAYDWLAIGQVADRVRIPLSTGTATFAGGDAAESLLNYAVTQIDRRKIQPALSTMSRDVVGEQVSYLSYRDALSQLADVQMPSAESVVAGEKVRIDLPALEESGGLHVDETTGAYWFAYTDDVGQTHKVWLEDAGSLASKLDLLSRWNLRGVALRDVSTSEVDPRMWETLTEFQSGGAVQAKTTNYSVVWTVQGDGGTEQIIQPVSASSLEWTAPGEPGTYHIQAGFSSDGGESAAVEPGGGGGVAVEVEEPTPTLTPLPPTPTPTPLPEADAVVNVRALNVREGPSTNYAKVDLVSDGDELMVTGKNEDGTWLQIQTDEIEKGWVSAQYTDIYLELEEVVVAEAPPEPTPAPRQNTVAGVSVAAAPRGNVGFGYGIQAHMLDADLNRIFNHINDLGFNWVKQQVEWFRFEPNKGQYNWGALDAIVNTANARGVNVLFSVVKAPHWARPGNTDWGVEGPPANPQDFADFMGAMAARYKGRVKAYEIWNEQNLGREWGNEPIDAGRYVQLLAAAYRAVKAQDPNAYVVSGAPTPTGVNNAFAMDDALYLEKMYQAGLARFSDGIGVHPSGYNNPPDASAGSWNDPSAPSFKGHRSFFFRDTLWTYYNIMRKYGDGGKRLWPTEFGWASVEGLGVGAAEGYGYANNNTQAEQAQFLVRAMQLARSWGFVGPMFVWNLNFGPVAGPHDEKGAFGILRPDWGARPAYAALRDMPK